IIGGIISFASFCLLFAHIILRLRKRKKEEGEEFINQQVPGMPVRFSYEDLCTATEGFKEKLGGGGFGSVFKGVLQDGTRIAVKRLDNLGQGMREFVAEVETIGSLHHFNLVRLMGFCAERSHRLLVYEFMSNGSLDKWIFNKDQRPRLDWQTRKKIVLDIAKGLAYLHEDCRQKIMHLDIKPQNILLDENFHAKVSDFGLSTLINRDESQVLTTMRGTPGYLAPEWRQLRITVKVDIYSFGIVVLEIVSARRNLDRSRSEFSFHLLEVLRGKAEEERLIDIVEYLDRDM
ncbi:Pkinase domain-containing protein, partial [Cephalotus follicularis]